MGTEFNMCNFTDLKRIHDEENHQFNQPLDLLDSSGDAYQTFYSHKLNKSKLINMQQKALRSDRDCKAESITQELRSKCAFNKKKGREVLISKNHGQIFQAGDDAGSLLRTLSEEIFTIHMKDQSTANHITMVK